MDLKDLMEDIGTDPVNQGAWGIKDAGTGRGKEVKKGKKEGNIERTRTMEELGKGMEGGREREK